MTGRTPRAWSRCTTSSDDGAGCVWPKTMHSHHRPVNKQQRVTCVEVNLDRLGHKLSRTICSHDLILMCATNNGGMCLRRPSCQLSP